MAGFNFKRFDIITITFDVRRCIVMVDRVDEEKKDSLHAFFGLNANNVLLTNSTFGLGDNFVRAATDEEKHELFIALSKAGLSTDDIFGRINVDVDEMADSINAISTLDTKNKEALLSKLTFGCRNELATLIAGTLDRDAKLELMRHIIDTF